MIKVYTVPTKEESTSELRDYMLGARACLDAAMQCHMPSEVRAELCNAQDRLYKVLDLIKG
jgi:hypothetical protein